MVTLSPGENHENRVIIRDINMTKVKKTRLLAVIAFICFSRAAFAREEARLLRFPTIHDH